MLLDVLNNNDTLATIMLSVVKQAAAISLVFYLFLITIVIYATFGITHFRKYVIQGIPKVLMSRFSNPFNNCFRIASLSF